MDSGCRDLPELGGDGDSRHPCPQCPQQWGSPVGTVSTRPGAGWGCGRCLSGCVPRGGFGAFRDTGCKEGVPPGSFWRPPKPPARGGGCLGGSQRSPIPLLWAVQCPVLAIHVCFGNRCLFWQHTSALPEPALLWLSWGASQWGRRWSQLLQMGPGRGAALVHSDTPCSTHRCLYAHPLPDPPTPTRHPAWGPHSRRPLPAAAQPGDGRRRGRGTQDPHPTVPPFRIPGRGLRPPLPPRGPPGGAERWRGARRGPNRGRGRQVTGRGDRTSPWNAGGERPAANRCPGGRAGGAAGARAGGWGHGTAEAAARVGRDVPQP